MIKNYRTLPALTILVVAPVYAQTDADFLSPILGAEILSPQVAVFQLRQYILNRVAKPPSPSSAEQWTAESKRLREQLLRDVVFHGWPREWVDAPPKFTDVGVIPGNGYRIRKLRYEIVPGFESVALLYEPENLRGKMPAILNVNGHVGAPGKSIEYKQKRCITLARHGILALNLEWLSYGELSQHGNEHWFGAHLDLVGANELGLFYLAMRKGLDYLYDHPNTDRARLGMTGLSGGGWQTIVLSSLDERVRLSVPVAGFSSISTRAEAKDYGDVGDFEQSATDFFDGRDFTHLAALMAPRPTLLIYNAEDDCCFRAGMVKPLVYDAIKPVFALYGKQDVFGWHENRDPGTHNYQIDNRIHAYRFFSSHFGLPAIQEDAQVGAEIKSYEDLNVGLPANNLTTLDLARKLARQIRRSPLPPDTAGREAERAKLKTVIRFRPAKMERAWAVGITKHTGIETKSHLFTMAGGLSATAVWLKPIGAPDTAPVTIVLDDKGKAASSGYIADRLNRGDQVLAVDLTFMGDSWKDNAIWEFQQMLYTTGDRPIGVQTAELIAIARWIKEWAHTSKVRLETSGIRSQVTALIAAAIEPDMFSEVLNRDGMRSLLYVLEKPVEFREAPDLFCLDLFQQTDLDRLAALAGTVRVPNQASGE
jgi:dienelactone hydrolase